jgi:hypothetical protein
VERGLALREVRKLEAAADGVHPDTTLFQF